MSISDYEIARQKISQFEGWKDFTGPSSSFSVAAATERLKSNFPPTYGQFLLDYGAASIGSSEIYGLVHDNLDYAGFPNLIWFAEKARTEWALPAYLFPIYNLGDGELFCIDTHLLTDESTEAPVVAHIPGFDIGKQDLDTIAMDFGAFFLSLVEQEIQRP